VSRSRSLHRLRSVRAVVASTLAVSLIMGTVACSRNEDSTQSSTDTAASSASESGQNSSTQANETWPRTVSTDRGEVKIPAKPKKVVSAAVTLTGSLLAIGAPVVASAGEQKGTPLTDDHGFFTQWSQVADKEQVKVLDLNPSAESILAEKPDLVVMSSAGQDATPDLYEQISEAVPTVLIDYSDKDWQDVATMLGKATGLEKKTSNVIKKFDDTVAKARDEIKKPAQPITPLVYTPQNKSARVWTKESAQGKLLTKLGFTLAEVPESARGANSMGPRSDVYVVSAENLPTAATGKTAFLFAADDKAVDAYKSNPVLADTPAVKNKSVYSMGTDTFRMDYYSSLAMIDRLEDLFD